MKRFNRTLLIPIVLLSTVIILGAGCNVFNIEDRSDPNNTEYKDLINNPSKSDISTLVAGTEAGLRTELRIYTIDVGMIGREMYRFLASEPRNTADLLGKGNAQLDAGSFYITRPWASFYTVIRNTNILMQASQKLTDEGIYTDQQNNGVKGYAKTMQAYEYLMALTLTNENGIRKQVPDDFTQVGDVLSKADSYALISSLLDDAATDLGNAGSSFPFKLTKGFDGLNEPATFAEFNRALRARVEIYKSNPDWDKVITDYLPASFIDANGDLKMGAYHVFGTGLNDMLNPIFADPQAGSGDSWVAHPSFVADAEAGDQRVAEKVQQRNQTASLDGLSSDYGLYVYKDQTAPIPIIRNAELILIRAEAKINRDQGTDLADAIDDLNIIRNAAGLPDYSGAITQSALLDEMLRQRRYELFMEGHRWVDMRRYGRLSQLPLDRAGDNVWESFPIPENENLGS